jgi:hypothetical protein
MARASTVLFLVALLALTLVFTADEVVASPKKSEEGKT